MKILICMSIAAITLMSISSNATTSRNIIIPGLKNELLNPEDSNKYLQIVIPNELCALDEKMKNGSDLEKAKAAITLVLKTQQAWHDMWSKYKGNRTIMPAVELKNTSVSRLYAWQRLIQVWKHINNSSAKELLIKEWDASLQKSKEIKNDLIPPLDELDVEYQILALDWEWEPAFMTQTFIQLFISTTDVDLLGDFCSVLGRWGGDAEEILIRKKIALNNADSTLHYLTRYENSVNLGISLGAIRMRRFHQGIPEPPWDKATTQPVEK